MYSIMSYVIVCVLVFLAGFVDAIGGGGGLISLPAFLIVGVPPHLAVGANKFSSVLGTCLSTARFARKGYVNRNIAIPTVLLSFCVRRSARGSR